MNSEEITIIIMVVIIFVNLHNVLCHTLYGIILQKSDVLIMIIIVMNTLPAPPPL